MGDDFLAQARRQVDRARRTLKNGREGASDEWVRAAEDYVQMAEAKYRRAIEDAARPAREADGR
jgi:hypothetical protein